MTQLRAVLTPARLAKGMLTLVVVLLALSAAGVASAQEPVPPPEPPDDTPTFFEDSVGSAAAVNDPVAAAESLPDGVVLVEGDIAMPADLVGGLYADLSAQSFWAPNLWPSGVVPYEFGAGVPLETQNDAYDAMGAWEWAAGVHFTPRMGEGNYIVIQSCSGNWSYVGEIGGPQTVCVQPYVPTGIIAHELGHALGLWHEHTRPDRDAYVTIHWDNIRDEMEYNFDIPNISWQGGTYGTYDFDSIMHYPAYTNNLSFVFDPSQPIITVKNDPTGDLTAGLGQRTHLSDLDILGMQAMYPDGPELVFPELYQLTTDTTPRYKWTEIEGATAYNLYVIYDEDGRKVWRKTYASRICNDNGICAVTPQRAQGDGGYWWIVTAYTSEELFSDWSLYEIESGTPELIGPFGDITDTTPRYRWTAADGATAYELLVTHTSNGAEVFRKTYATRICDAGRCAVTPGLTLPRTGYTYSVRAVKDAGSVWSDPAQFTIR